VILTPDEIKIKVFSRGIPNGLIGWIPALGHACPNSQAGFNDL